MKKGQERSFDSLQSLAEEFFPGSMESKFYPDHSDSPTIGQLHCLWYVGAEEEIPQEVINSVLEKAEHKRDVLEFTINGWNRVVGKSEMDYQDIERGLFVFMKMMSESYGSASTAPEDRKKLMGDAFEIRKRGISSN